MKQLPHLFRWMKADNTIECRCDDTCCHTNVQIHEGDFVKAGGRGMLVQTTTGQTIRVKEFVVVKLSTAPLPSFGDK